MYFILSRLDAPKFCKLDFIVNFGVAPSTKTELTHIIENANSIGQVYQFFESLDTLTLLKLHKYFFWADKKLHSVFFIENKDQISEDLLIDFRSEEDQEKYRQSEQLAARSKANKNNKKKEAKNIDVNRAKNTITKEDLIFGASNNLKTVNIMGQDDFPDLSGSDDDLPAPVKTNNRRNQGQKFVKKQQPIRFGEGQDGDWGISA